MSTPVNRVKAVRATAKDAATLDPVNYIVLKTLEAPIFYMRIVNASNTPVEISYDKTPNPGKIWHDYLMPEDKPGINFQANNEIPGHIANLAKGTVVYIRGTAGVGQIIFTGYTSQP